MTLRQKLKYNMIGDKAFYKLTFAVLIPIIIQNTVTNVVNLVDNVMIGAVGTLEMSAVGIINQLVLVFTLCIFGSSAGVGIFTSQYVGAGDKEGVRNCFRMKLYLGMTVLAVATAIFLILPDQLIGSYIADDTTPATATATINFAKEYLYIMLIGFPPFVLSQVYGSILRETGEAKLPMVASVWAILINVVFNYILIFGNEGLHFLPFAPMGVAGAAIATVFSRYVEFLIIVIVVHKNKIKYDFMVRIYHRLTVPLSLVKDIIRKGAPLLFNEFLWSFGMAAIMQCYSVRGIDVVAATNIFSTVSNLFKVIYMSIGISIGIVIGQYLGANRIDEAKTAVWRLLTLTALSSVITAILLFAAAPFIPQIYNVSDSVKQLSTELLWMSCIATPFSALGLGGYFTIRSGGKTLITMLFDGAFVWYANYPLAFCIAHYTKMDIVPFFLLVQSLDLIKAVLLLILIKNGFWAKNIVNKNSVS